MPCFTVDDRCAVTIGGDLTVQGQIRDTSGKCPDIVSTGLTKEAKDFVLNGMLSGVGGSSTLLDRFFKNPAPGGAGDAIAAPLAADAGLLSDVATVLKTKFPDKAGDLKNLLWLGGAAMNTYIGHVHSSYRIARASSPGALPAR